MTTAADKTIFCKCGEQSRAYWDYETDEQFIVGEREVLRAGKEFKCEACGRVLDIHNQEDNWTPVD